MKLCYILSEHAKYLRCNMIVGTEMNSYRENPVGIIAVGIKVVFIL